MRHEPLLFYTVVQNITALFNSFCYILFPLVYSVGIFSFCGLVYLHHCTMAGKPRSFHLTAKELNPKDVNWIKLKLHYLPFSSGQAINVQFNAIPLSASILEQNCCVELMLLDSLPREMIIPCFDNCPNNSL